MSVIDTPGTARPAWKGKPCAYCGQTSAGGDHTIALQFFLEADRDTFPQVPASDACNRETSALQHYLTAILPFGGRHVAGHVNLRDRENASAAAPK